MQKYTIPHLNGHVSGRSQISAKCIGVNGIVSRSKHWVQPAELPQGKRPLVETYYELYTGLRVPSMLRYRSAMTPAALLEHQLHQRSSTDCEEVRSDVSPLAAKSTNQYKCRRHNFWYPDRVESIFSEDFIVFLQHFLQCRIVFRYGFLI